MRFSFVLANGRLPVDGTVVEGDGRLYHFDLPRADGDLTRVRYRCGPRRAPRRWPAAAR